MKNNKGFTLIELLVVVLIIGILAAIALPQYFKAVEKSRAAEASTVMGAINHAQALYLMANPSTYGDIKDLDVDLPNAAGTETTTYTGTNFNYAITKTPTHQARIVATRNANGGYKMQVTFSDGTRKCQNGAANSRTEAICQSLGYKAAEIGTIAAI